jgi:hypothetical protein
MTMKSFALALAATLTLAAPVAAQSMSVLLPLLSFPDEIVTPSTKNCGETATTKVCQIQE